MTPAQKVAKHVPERTCIACRRQRPKWELVRIVRTSHGTLEIDSRGKKAGRGAYLCKQRGCWEKGIEKKKLAHFLRTDVSPEQRIEFLEYGKAFPASAENHSGHSSEGTRK